MKRAMQGTLEYMAPEVLLKKPASTASDVYALAIAINELATGKQARCRTFRRQPCGFILRSAIADEFHSVHGQQCGRLHATAGSRCECLRARLAVLC